MLHAMLERFLALTAAAPEAVALIDGDDAATVTSRAQLASRIDELAARFAACRRRRRGHPAPELRRFRRARSAQC